MKFTKRAFNLALCSVLALLGPNAMSAEDVSGSDLAKLRAEVALFASEPFMRSLEKGIELGALKSSLEASDPSGKEATRVHFAGLSKHELVKIKALVRTSEGWNFTFRSNRPTTLSFSKLLSSKLLIDGNEIQAGGKDVNALMNEVLALGDAPGSSAFRWFGGLIPEARAEDPRVRKVVLAGILVSAVTGAMGKDATGLPGFLAGQVKACEAEKKANVPYAKSELVKRQEALFDAKMSKMLSTILKKEEKDCASAVIALKERGRPSATGFLGESRDVCRQSKQLIRCIDSVKSAGRQGGSAQDAETSMSL